MSSGERGGRRSHTGAAGRTRDQAAELLDISPRQADRVWAFARAWLATALADNPQKPETNRQRRSQE